MINPNRVLRSGLTVAETLTLVLGALAGAVQTVLAVIAPAADRPAYVAIAIADVVFALTVTAILRSHR